LRDAGFDARYMKGGHSAWKAIGGPMKMHAWRHEATWRPATSLWSV